MVARKLIVLFVVFASVQSSSAQYDNIIYHSDTEISPADSHLLFFRFGNATFINNKEFFNPYQSGYTLLGFFLRPVLEYYPGPDTKLTAGVHLLNYSGVERYSRAIPVFSFHHRFSSGLEMVAGSLYGSLNHDLIEPLFSHERMFTSHNESGLQFLIKREFFTADIWVNWERFIFPGDPFQEEFTAGFSSRIHALNSESKFNIDLPVQLLVTHKGGQINDSDERMQSLVNFATGVHIDWITGHSFFESLSFGGYLAGFRDLSNELRHHYDNGWGIYPNLIVQTRWAQAGLGYWQGNRFVAPRGEPLFQSVSRENPDIANDYRELVTSKIIFNRSLTPGIDMSLRFEVFYDTIDGNFDHFEGLHILIDERFFITRLRRR